MRKRIIITAFFGIIFSGISGIIFLFSDSLLTFIIGLLILFPGLIGSCVAIFFTMFHILRQSMLKTKTPLQSTCKTEHVLQLGKRIRIIRTNRAGSISNLKFIAWPLTMLILLVIMNEILPNLAKPFVNSQHFGAFVAFPLLIFSFLALLYGFSYKRYTS